MKVRIADTRPGHLAERFVMEDGAIFWVNRRGWILDKAKKFVAHPMADEVAQAIIEWDATR